MTNLSSESYWNFPQPYISFYARGKGVSLMDNVYVEYKKPNVETIPQRCRQLSSLVARWSDSARIFMKTNCRWSVSHNGYVYGGGLTIGTTTCSMTVPFDDCNKWGPPPSSSPTCSQTILPPAATPRFEFNKWPNHSTPDYVALKNWNFPAGGQSLTI